MCFNAKVGKPRLAPKLLKALVLLDASSGNRGRQLSGTVRPGRNRQRTTFHSLWLFAGH